MCMCMFVHVCVCVEGSAGRDGWRKEEREEEDAGRHEANVHIRNLNFELSILSVLFSLIVAMSYTPKEKKNEVKKRN